MDLLALQQRANILVQKVNDYEASIEGEDIDENTELEQHKYADLFCLRPVMKLLFGQTVEEKLNRTLDNDLDLRLFASTVPMYNSSFKLFGILSDDLDFKSDTHEFMNNIDVYNASNMIQLDVLQNTIQDRDSRISQGLNYSYSANIADALATESQVANVFKWNTTLADDEELVNNTVTINRQVPGIVCYYLGNGYTNNYTATVSCNDTTSSINAVNYMFPSTYGAFFNKEDITKSQVQENRVENLAALKLFIPGTHYTRGKLESPQQIWQPEAQYGEDNTTGFNYQGQALYQELVFKDRRANAADNSVDFIPALSDVPDNDPQGLLLRTTLAQQKQYYINRPWFNELDKVSLNVESLANELADISQTVIKKAGINEDILKFYDEPMDVTEDGLVSGFSDQKSIIFKDPTTWSHTEQGTEVVIEFTTGSDINTVQKIIAGGDNTNSWLKLYIDSSWFLHYSWNPQQPFYITQIAANTKYRFKFVFIGPDTFKVQQYNFNTDKYADITINLTDRSLKVDNNAHIMVIGNAELYTGQPYISGSINLKNSSIKLKSTSEPVSFYQAASEIEVKYTDEMFYNSYQCDYETYNKGVKQK